MFNFQNQVKAVNFPRMVMSHLPSLQLLLNQGSVNFKLRAVAHQASQPDQRGLERVIHNPGNLFRLTT